MKSHNSTNVDIRKVNSILQQLETIMNTSTDITFEEAGNILLNVSKWKNADMHTVEVSYDTMLNLKQRYILLKVLFECFFLNG